MEEVSWVRFGEEELGSVVEMVPGPVLVDWQKRRRRDHGRVWGAVGTERKV